MYKIVATDWLASHLEDPNLIVLDASYPAVGGQKPIHEGIQIKGARKFEIDYFSDQETTLPHMLAPEEEFVAKAQGLGIDGESHLVIYDNLGIYSSPRAWWMFRSMGHEKVSVLDGGLPKWIQEGHPVAEVSDTTFQARSFKGKLADALVKSMDEVRENINSGAFQLIDARSSGRFEGSAPEPRPHLRSGHIEGSINIPFQDVLENGGFKSKEKLRALFEEVPKDKPMVFSCGSGLTACIVLLAAHMVTDNEKAVYDGSWSEWASVEGNPIC